MRKIKNTVLKIITYAIVIVFLASGSMLDSDSWVTYIVCAASLAWISLLAYANKELLERRWN